MLSITELPLKNLARITGTMHEDPSIFMIISRLFLLRMRIVLEKKLYRKLKLIFYAQ
jgi:hypothetical protein